MQLQTVCFKICKRYVYIYIQTNFIHVVHEYVNTVNFISEYKKPNLDYKASSFSGKKACTEVAKLCLAALYTTNHWQIESLLFLVLWLLRVLGQLPDKHHERRRSEHWVHTNYWKCTGFMVCSKTRCTCKGDHRWNTEAIASLTNCCSISAVSPNKQLIAQTAWLSIQWATTGSIAVEECLACSWLTHKFLNGCRGPDIKHSRVNSKCTGINNECIKVYGGCTGVLQQSFGERKKCMLPAILHD